MQHKIEEYVIWRCNNVDAVLRKPPPLFVIVLWCLLVHESHNSVSYVYICIQPRPSIDCCCRSQKCYPCSMSVSHEIAAAQSTRPLHHSHLIEARPGACKLAGATYSAVHHTYRSIAKTCQFSRVYAQLRTYNILIAQILTRTSILAIWVTSGSAVVTPFQH